MNKHLCPVMMLYLLVFMSSLMLHPVDRKPGATELDILLDKSAQYCEALKSIALRFLCVEEITETVQKAGAIIHSRKWTNNYQILLENGVLTENRTKGPHRTGPSRKVSLKTRYMSEYSFFLPVTFLSKTRQKEYQYALIKKGRKKNRSVIVLSAMPRNPQTDLPAGELWIDQNNGSVLEIRLDPHRVSGFQDRIRDASRRNMQLNITDTHQYFQHYKGIQFPTSTLITEHQIKRERPSIYTLPDPDPVIYTVSYRFKDFRFFDVQTKELIHGWIER